MTVRFHSSSVLAWFVFEHVCSMHWTLIVLLAFWHPALHIPRHSKFTISIYSFLYNNIQWTNIYSIKDDYLLISLTLQAKITCNPAYLYLWCHSFQELPSETSWKKFLNVDFFHVTVPSPLWPISLYFSILFDTFPISSYISVHMVEEEAVFPSQEFYLVSLSPLPRKYSHDPWIYSF